MPVGRKRANCRGESLLHVGVTRLAIFDIRFLGFGSVPGTFCGLDGRVVQFGNCPTTAVLPGLTACPSVLYYLLSKTWSHRFK